MTYPQVKLVNLQNTDGNTEKKKKDNVEIIILPKTREEKAVKALENIIEISEVYFNNSKFRLITKIAKEGLMS